MNLHLKPILVIEDDSDLLVLLTFKLREFSNQIVSFQTGNEAIEWLVDHEPYFMILDYSLPDMNANEFIVELINKGIDLPAFLVSTGQGDERIAVEMMKLGARDYLVKDGQFLEMFPVIVQKLISSIDNEKRLKDAEKSIVDLNQFNKQIIQSTNEGIIVYDKELNYQIWNPFMEKFTGLSSSEVIGKRPEDLFPFLQANGIVENISKSLKGEMFVNIEFPFKIEQTGKSGWASDSVAPLFNAENDIIGVISTVRDVTERKQAEINLKKSEEKYRKIFENIRDVFFQTKLDGQILELSPSIKFLTGFNREELIGRSIIDLYFNPVDRQRFIEELVEKNEIHDSERIFKTKSGDAIFISINAHIVKYRKEIPVFIEGIFRDISDRKLAEMTILESEAKLRLVFDTMEEGITLNELVYNDQGQIVDYKILEVNSAFEKTAGVKKEMVIGKMATEVYKMPQDYITDFWDKHLNDKVPIKSEIFYPETNKWLFISTSLPIENKFVASFFDITERKQLEIKLQESEYFFKESQRAGKIGSYKTDFTIDQWVSSDVLDDIFGIDLAYNRSIDGWLALVHPDDREMMHKYLVEEVVMQKKNFDKQYRILRQSDGETRWVKGMGEPEFDKDGNILSLIGTINDITDLMLAEKQLHLLNSAIQQSTVSVVITNKSGEIEYVNPKFSEVTGYSDNEAKGQNPRVLKSGMQHEEFYKDLWDTILSGKSWQGEFHNKKKNGQSYWESAVISPVYNDRSEIEHFIAIKEDITDKKWMLGQLIEAKNKAEENERLKSAFLQNISHEIRTPMNSIVGFSKLLQRPDLSADKQRNYTSIIMNSTNQLLSIYSDILTISSLETQQERLFVQKVELNEMLADLYDQFLEQKRNKDIEFILNCPLSNELAEIYADKIKLSQILSNLLFNAFKFTQKGKIEFGYTTEGLFQDEKEPKILFYAKDTGIGIDEKIHTKIFDRFYQADHSINRKYGGNGIGLSISKGFVELMGGEIWVESVPENGSVFKFTIPFRPISEHTMESILLKRKRLVKTILVAEDELFNYLLIEEILSDMNYTLIHAYDGKEALNICMANKDIDMILMDIKMPNMDGKTATEEIRKIRPEIPIIALTAYALDRDIEKYSKMFDSYITKPIDGDGLKQLIFDFFDISDD